MLIRSALGAGRSYLGFAGATTAADASPRPAPVIVPILVLSAAHRAQIVGHLTSLEPTDRYLRFGYIAPDEAIHRYVESIDFDQDRVLGIYNRKLTLIAVAHLAYPATDAGQAPSAEFGVSVLPAARGRGYGTQLFNRATMHAMNAGIHLFLIHALTENEAMLAIARNAGATLIRDGSESEAHLRLPDANVPLSKSLSRGMHHACCEMTMICN